MPLSLWFRHVALSAAVLAGTAAPAMATTVLRGTLPTNGTAPQVQQMPACPSGYYYTAGRCYLYSWDGVFSQW